MKALPAIARYMRLPEEQLRYPVELIQQGYEPNYLATYRPDELGGIDVETLARLKRAVEYETNLGAHKERVLQSLEREHQSSDAIASVIGECTSISQVDAIARSLKSKKNAKMYADSEPRVEAIGRAILMYQGVAPNDMVAWVAGQAGCSLEEAEVLLAQTKRWLQLLMCEDAKLLLQLQRAILNNANVSLTILPEPAKQEDSEREDSVHPGNPNLETHEPTAASPAAESSTAVTPVEVVAESELGVQEAAPEATPEVVAQEQVATEAVVPDAVAQDVVSGVPESESPGEAAVASDASPVAPLIEQFHVGRKKSKAIRTKSLSDKQLSPRQRRRRWLRGILESYGKLRKPLRALTPYQVLMISRGIRSRIVDLNFQQDLKPLVHACRETLCPGRHPLHPVLMQMAEEGLKELLLPKLHQDVLAILEEDSNQELIESAVLHLQSSLLQRPVRGHRILLIDAVGLKTAAIAIVDLDGTVLRTAEIPCNSSKPDVVTQNLKLLGQLVHEHQVTLIAMSNGPARRYLVHSLVELLKQSSEGSLYWTMVDRAGCDAYCMSRTSLVELPRISRRHRASVWLAWRLQDPLRQILKVDPARLRLGSYQRELPQSELESALQESVSATLTKAGVDVFSVDADVLKRIPGMTQEAAARVSQEREAGNITDRESLMRCLRESLNEMQARQAIGFLRVFDSENPLDGTIIHPDDYRLADRLIAHANLSLPPKAPEGWQKPDYEKIAAAHAAVANLALEGTLSESNAKEWDGTKPDLINPNFGVLAAEPSTDSVMVVGESEVADEPVQDLASDAESNSLEAAAVTDEPSSDEPSSEVATSEDATAEDATAEDATAEVTTSEAEGVEPDQPSTPSAASEAEGTEDSVTSSEATGKAMPEIATKPMVRPSLVVDAEKLARSWQVGRAKLMSVAHCLQFPFVDVRDFHYPVPLRSQVPKLESLPPETMLNALVIGVAEFGVFVELGPDCSGLIHISRLASDFVEDPHQFVQVGDVIPVWVVNVDEKRKRVSLTAIPPGSAERKRDGASGQHDSSGHRSGSGRDRPSDRNTGSNRGQDRPAGAVRSGAPAGAGAPAGRSDGNRNRRDGGRPGGRGGYGAKGQGNRRRDDERQDGDAASRRPVRIDKPQPQKPITEAMQQGKEPLRSFSDLMQFMKSSKTDGPEETLEGKDTKAVASEAPAADAPVIGGEPKASENGSSLESDANSSA